MTSAEATWLAPYLTLSFGGTIAVAALVSVFARRWRLAEDRGTLVPSFVVEFTALLLFGVAAATLIAALGLVIEQMTGSKAISRRTVAHGLVRVLAIQASGYVYAATGGTAGQFAWPFEALPIAAALLAHCSLNIALAQLVARLIARQPIGRDFPNAIAREVPNYVVAAGIAALFAHLVDQRMWEVLSIGAAPLYFAYRGYCSHLGRVEDEHRHESIADSVNVAACVVDAQGKVTFWNDTISRLVACPRENAIGRPLASAVPALRSTVIPNAIAQVLKDGSHRTISSITLPPALNGRIVDIKLIRDADGVSLLWHDVTERASAEQATQRSAERLALAAEGAHDGLWEWDLRSNEFFASARWRTMLGLEGPSTVGSPDEWLTRVHPDDAPGLNSAMKSQLEAGGQRFSHEHRLRHEDGTYRWVLCQGLYGGPGRKPSRIAGSLTDITDRVTIEEQLRTAGFLDPLTRLRNRADFERAVGTRLEHFKRRPEDGKFGLIYLDLDRFKIVNDSLGHLVGDQLLIAVARRLESCLRDGDILARLGGDEFAILLTKIVDGGQANAVAFRIQDALSARVLIGGREVFTSVSMGVAFGHADYGSPDEIMRDADTAMYHAKTHGKARHEVFDADMHTRARDRLGFESDLRQAVSSNDFEVHYQPIVLLGSGMCVGFESLVRWRRNGEMVSPAIFIPMAEELGLITSLGTWILHQACHAFADWQRRFPHAGLEYITVNASGRQLTQPTFVFEVEQAVHQSGLKPSAVRIEITETALMDSPDLAVDVLNKLREFGVKIYLDDFGTGYSSLSHLHKLPVDALKIDRSFVKSMLLPERPAIVESILALAHTMHTGVVAEGIEDDIQAQELERLGCTHAQGYLFSKPISASAVEELITANRPLGPKGHQREFSQLLAAGRPSPANGAGQFVAVAR